MSNDEMFKELCKKSLCEMLDSMKLEVVRGECDAVLAFVRQTDGKVHTQHCGIGDEADEAVFEMAMRGRLGERHVERAIDAEIKRLRSNAPDYGDEEVDALVSFRNLGWPEYQVKHGLDQKPVTHTPVGPKTHLLACCKAVETIGSSGDENDTPARVCEHCGGGCTEAVDTPELAHTEDCPFGIARRWLAQDEGAELTDDDINTLGNGLAISESRRDSWVSMTVGLARRLFHAVGGYR